MPTFTQDDLLSALTATLGSRATNPGGLSVAELVAQIGVPRPRVLELLRRLQGERRLTCAKAMRLAIDGSYRPVPVYTVRP